MNPSPLSFRTSNMQIWVIIPLIQIAMDQSISFRSGRMKMALWDYLWSTIPKGLNRSAPSNRSFPLTSLVQSIKEWTCNIKYCLPPLFQCQMWTWMGIPTSSSPSSLQGDWLVTSTRISTALIAQNPPEHSRKWACTKRYPAHFTQSFQPPSLI